MFMFMFEVCLNNLKLLLNYKLLTFQVKVSFNLMKEAFSIYYMGVCMCVCVCVCV